MTGQSRPFPQRAELEAHLNQIPKIMKKLLLSLALGMAAIGLATPKAQAIMLSGSITFPGGAGLNTAAAGTATAVTNWVNPVVQSRDGDFLPAAVNAAVAIVAPWNFTTVAAVPNFWTVAGFSFQLDNSAVAFQFPGFVNVVGNGTFTAPGFDATPGIWRFTSQDPSAGTPAVFSFSASNQTVPEGGSAVAMLGMGLLGLAAARKKLVKTA